MANNDRELGLYLKELRIVKDLSLRDVERETNNAVSNAYLSQLESGKIIKPSPHILESLARVYNVPYEDLMAVAGYMHQSKTKKSGVAFFNQQDLSADEKRKLLDYLQLMRKHQKQ